MRWFHRRPPTKAPTLVAGPAREPTITVIAGPHAGSAHPLTPERLVDGSWTIGRSTNATIALTRDRFVSRLHARIRPAGDGWTVEDHPTRRNASRLDGVALAPAVPVPLGVGMMLECGRSVLVLRNP